MFSKHKTKAASLTLITITATCALGLAHSSECKRQTIKGRLMHVCCALPVPHSQIKRTYILIGAGLICGSYYYLINGSALSFQ